MNSIPITGFVRAVLKNKAGDILEIVESENLVVGSGNNMVTGRLIDNAVAIPKYIGWGSSNTVAASADTILLDEFTTSSWPSYARITTVPGAGSAPKIEITVNILSYVFSLVNNSGMARIIYEVGIFNALTSGSMLARWLTGGISLQNTDSLSITWQLTIGT